ncbi:MAG: hypothetical protein J6B06_02965, partial [Lachnospiraceae bacterium]|nr:hypothetical protein [Lachnospiraceae bacterium]
TDQGVLSCEMEQMRIPVNNSFQESYYNKMSVLDVDFDQNTKELHKFIFGDTEENGLTVEETTTK